MNVFDIGALPYDLITAQDTWRESCRRMAALLPREPIRIGLDLGAGPGVSAIELARARPEARWIAADLSLAMLRRARENLAAAKDLARPIELLAADALALPLRDASVDAATGHSLVYLLPSRLAGLLELRRVLKPGGTLVYLEPSPHVSPLRLARFIAANAASPRFGISMLGWRVAGRLSTRRITPAQTREYVLAARYRTVETHETLGGLGYFVVATA